jgi:hypothetical protein
VAVLPGRRHHEQWQGRQLGGNVHARWRRRTNGVDVPTDDFILLSLHPRRGARRHAPAAELRRGTSCGHGHARRPRSSHAGPAAAPAMRAARLVCSTVPFLLGRRSARKGRRRRCRRRLAAGGVGRRGRRRRAGEGAGRRGRREKLGKEEVPDCRRRRAEEWLGWVA